MRNVIYCSASLEIVGVEISILIDDSSSSSSPEALLQDMDRCYEAVASLTPSAIVFNLFSLFGYHIAEVIAPLPACMPSPH
jgi:hypothetical protein